MKLTIDRKTWTRGGRNGSPGLLNKDGNKCCLGFHALNCGYTENEILEKGTLSTLANTTTKDAKVLKLVKPLGNITFGNIYQESELSSLLMYINDSFIISDETREKILKNEFEKIGVEVTFE